MVLIGGEIFVVLVMCGIVLFKIWMKYLVFLFVIWWLVFFVFLIIVI